MQYFVQTIQQESNEVNKNIPEVISNLAFRFYHRYNRKDIGTEKQTLEIKRYLGEDFFAAKISFLGNETFRWVTHFQINNKDNILANILNIEPQQWNESILAPPQVKNLKFKQLKSLSSISNQRNDQIEKLRFLSQVAIDNKTNLKEYVMTDQGLKFKTPKIIRNIASANYDQVDSIDQIFYNNIVLFPQKFIHGRHNTVVYKVASYNDDQSSIDLDLALLPKKISNLGLKNNGSLDLVFVKKNASEKINGLDIIGNIEIASNTYYDFTTQQTVEGLSFNSQRGYILPFNFRGDLAHVVSLDLNADFANLQIIFRQNIPYKYFDHFEGKRKLILTENVASNSFIKYFKIPQKNFGKIATGNLSLVAIQNLTLKGKEDEYII